MGRAKTLVREAADAGARSGEALARRLMDESLPPLPSANSRRGSDPITSRRHSLTMTGTMWLIVQWAAFIIVAGALAWMREAARAQLAEARARLAERELELFTACRAIRSAGGASAHIGALVERTLARCPMAAAGAHETGPGSRCKHCGLGLAAAAVVALVALGCGPGQVGEGDSAGDEIAVVLEAKDPDADPDAGWLGDYRVIDFDESYCEP